MTEQTTRAPITLAIDAMGGYHGPDAALDAVAQASAAPVTTQPVTFTLVGDERLLTRGLNARSHNPERINIAHAPRVVGMGESAAQIAAGDGVSSIQRACELVGEGLADAVLSAGNPGATVIAARACLALIPGITRAPLATVYPIRKPRADNGEHPLGLLLDVGASLYATPDDLVAYARMGAAYARLVSGNPQPRVALLSSSREPTVGPRHVVQAHTRLQALTGINYIGCVEGHDLTAGEADVIVCDGYVGDVSIKVMEGFGEAAFEIARDAYAERFLYRQGLRLLSGGIKKLKRLIDLDEYGGAPLLGLSHTVILADPRAQSRALRNAISLAIKNTRAELPQLLAQALDAP